MAACCAVALSVTVTACTTVQGPRSAGPVVDLASPLPVTTPLPVTEQEFKEDLQRVRADLVPSEPGEVAAQADLVQACLRLAALSQALQDEDKRTQLQQLPIVPILLKSAASTCPTEPAKAAEDIAPIINGSLDVTGEDLR